jgi:coenzyme F420-reducing hydrogenase alpha subunit
VFELAVVAAAESLVGGEVSPAGQQTREVNILGMVDAFEIATRKKT